MEISTFRANCNACSETFAVPLLSDFSYGEFIARAQDGRTHGYLNSVEEPGWDSVEHALNIVKIQTPDLSDFDSTKCFQWLVGKCMDSINGQELSIVSRPVCPACASSEISYSDADLVGYESVPSVTFSTFMGLDEPKRISLVSRLLGEFDSLGQENAT